jgi:hypothetical protein
MSKERMGTLPQEEIANAMASRTLNDAELIKGGAEYAVDSEGNSRLELRSGEKGLSKEAGCQTDQNRST